MLDILAKLFSELFFFVGYVGGGNSFPEPLTGEKERECLERLKLGDAEARAMLIEHNLRLVAHIARKYAAPRRDSDDLISTGTVGLIKAVSTYREGKSSTLATYAARCIENEILMSLRSEKKRSGEVSLSDPLGTDGEGNEVSLADILGSDADMIHAEAERSIGAEELRQAMERALTAREATVVRLRYGLVDGRCLAQREVAEVLGISRSYVSRLEKKALAKLRQTVRV